MPDLASLSQQESDWNERSEEPLRVDRRDSDGVVLVCIIR